MMMAYLSLLIIGYSDDGADSSSLLSCFNLFFFFAVIACVYTLAILVSDENLQKKRRRKQLLPQFFRRWTFPCLILFLYDQVAYLHTTTSRQCNSDPKKQSKSYLGDGEKIQTFHQRCIILFYSILCYLYGQCSVRYIY